MTPARTVPHKAIRAARTRADKLGVTAVCRRPPGPVGRFARAQAVPELPLAAASSRWEALRGPARPTRAHAQARPRKRRRR
ncbi:hypothetical protein HPB52_011039 [Rhipicephalus sanguineus]|uniref:Uncharacterized protein n=1 Tax=Rhipicephalus sanguineus TaxID=34632 RepID=A0A9D4SYU3_RHISA|nr:hypothetical protein HPB52_011039 [Rhipicephalus sanguineus]